MTTIILFIITAIVLIILFIFLKNIGAYKKKTDDLIHVLQIEVWRIKYPPMFSPNKIYKIRFTKNHRPVSENTFDYDVVFKKCRCLSRKENITHDYYSSYNYWEYTFIDEKSRTIYKRRQYFNGLSDTNI